MTESSGARPLRPSQVRCRSIAGLLVRLPTARLHGDPDALVTGITHDSRQVRPGDVYLARPGERTHGIDHVQQALAAGAVAVLTDPPSVEAAVRARAAAVVEVSDPRAATGPAAAWIYDDPTRDLLVIGVTGTNGKTTTAYLLEAGLRAAAAAEPGPVPEHCGPAGAPAHGAAARRPGRPGHRHHARLPAGAPG
jgi:UDP-N-acetylmuramoyl-L-alanyl-D-glutamate--2,6-diaminopimelate ligase